MLVSISYASGKTGVPVAMAIMEIRSPLAPRKNIAVHGFAPKLFKEGKKIFVASEFILTHQLNVKWKNRSHDQSVTAVQPDNLIFVDDYHLI